MKRSNSKKGVSTRLTRLPPGRGTQNRGGQQQPPDPAAQDPSAKQEESAKLLKMVKEFGVSFARLVQEGEILVSSAKPQEELAKSPLMKLMFGQSQAKPTPGTTPSGEQAGGKAKMVLPTVVGWAYPEVESQSRSCEGCRVLDSGRGHPPICRVLAPAQSC